MKVFSFFTLFLFYLSSCSNHNISTEVKSTTFPIAIELTDCFNGQNTELKLSELAQSISYIKLETTNESILGSILTVNPIENGFIIADSKESIMFFDKEGKFKWKINNKGRGPTEYAELSVPLGIDTVFKEIIVPDNRKLVIYDFTGQFKRKLNLSVGAGGVHVLPSGYYVLWTTSPFKTSLAHIIDRNGRIIKHFPNHDLSKRLNEDGVFRDLSISIYNPYENGLFLDNKDTIWLLDSNLSLNPWFIINSKVKNYSDRYYTYGYNVVNQSLIGFFFALKRQYYLYNIDSKKFYSHETMIQDDIDFCLPVSPGSGHGGTFINILSPVSLLAIKTELRQGSSINNIASSIKEDDNPIIRIIKLKE